jgi:hypothetical protein
MGPAFADPKELRYEKVLTTPWTGIPLDLKVTVAEGSTYEVANTAYNGLWPSEDPGHQQMAQVNVKDGTQTTFDFTFVESGTDTPHVLSNVFFSVYDLDMFSRFPNHEYVKFPQPVSKWKLTTPTELVQSGSNDGTLTFTATKFGSVSDNPTDPNNLTGLQQSRSVTIWESSTASFQATFGHWYDEKVATWPSTGIGGRNFLFAGPGVFCPAK